MDLDLDVVRRRGIGRVELRDEDEFAEHIISFGYPNEVVRPARAAAAWLRTALAEGRQPFASDYLAFLEQVHGPSA